MDLVLHEICLSKFRVEGRVVKRGNESSEAIFISSKRKSEAALSDSPLRPKLLKHLASPSPLWPLNTSV